MNFFQLQNKLFYSRKNNCEPLDNEGELSFVPYMHNRWLSFYSPEMNTFVNNTLNKYSALFIDNKQEQYKFYYNLIPTLKFKRITYTKKQRQDKDDELIGVYAKNNCISQREVKQYIELQQSLAK